MIQPTTLIRKHPEFSGICIVVLLTLIHFFFFHGSYFGFDDLGYCQLAFNLINGTYDHDTLYAYRYGAILPLAFSYLIFGVNDFANMAAGLMTLIFITLLVFRMMAEVPLSVKLITASFIAVAPMHLMYVEKPMPDLVSSLGFLLCFYSYYKLRFPSDKVVSLATPVAIFVSGAILVFVSKETFLLIYPYFAGLFLIDIFDKRHLAYWSRIFVLLFVFLVVYFLSYYLFMGDPWSRIHALFEDRYISECTYEFQPISVILGRILYSLWLEFVRSGFLLPVIFLPILFSLGRLDKPFHFIGWSWVTLLLIANFMTISYTHYVPLCDDPRHFLFVLPIGILFMGYALTRLKSFSFCSWAIALLLLIGLLSLSVVYQYENSWGLFLPLILGWIVYYLQRRAYIVYISFMIGLSSYFITNAQYNKGINHNGQKALIESITKADDVPKVIYTDHANVNLAAFYTLYDSSQYKIVAFRDIDTLIADPSREQFIILNGMTMYYAKSSWESLPQQVKSAHEQLPVFYENEAGVVYSLE